VRAGFDYWPGFVDALSVMLLVMIFLLSVFMLAQFFLSRDISGKDTALNRLNQQIDDLTALLALERAKGADARSSIELMTSTLNDAQKDKDRLQGLLDARVASADAAGGAATQAQQALDAEKQISARAA